jgi:uncharacterized RmlC-like cupin family protein
MADERESMTPTARVIRTTESYIGKQGPSYAGGVSAESAGSQAIWLGMITVPPGGRTKAHYHEEHETALYMVSGVIDMWYGDQLEHYEECLAGDYIYIPAGVPHVAVNRSQTEPALVVGSEGTLPSMSCDPMRDAACQAHPPPLSAP